MTALRLVALSALCALAAGLFAGPDRAAAADGPISFNVGSERRSAYVVERARLRRQSRPVLIVLSGAASNPTLSRRSIRFEQFANRGGILVFGQSKGGWRPGADVDYVRALVRAVSQRRLVDPRRIHIVGQGSGGVVALQSACRDGKLFAGVAAILASLPADAAAGCAPGKPLPTLLIAGTADKRMPFGGGAADLADYKGAVAGVEATLAPFAKAAGCADKRSRRDVTDRDPTDGSRVAVEQFEGCKAVVRLVRIEGGGHFVPAIGASRAPRSPGQNRDISAARAVLNAFGLSGS